MGYHLLETFSDILEDVVLISMSPRYVIEWVNDNARIYHGWDQKRVVGKNYLTICQDNPKGQVIADKISKLNPKNPKIKFHDHGQSGNKIWIATYLQPKTKKPSTILLMGYDFFKEEFLQLQNSLNTIIDSIPGTVFWKDKSGVYLGCNEAMVQISNLKAKTNIIGKTDHELWPKQAQQLLAADEKVISSGETIEAQEEMHISGQNLWFASVKAPLKDQHGEIIGVVGNSLEITELIMAKAKAKESERTKMEFLQNMAHDLRTPTAGIAQMLKILEEKAEGQQKEKLGYVSRASEQLLRLLNDILNFSRDDIEKDSVITKEFDIRATLNSIIDIEFPIAQTKNLELSFECSSEVPKLLVGDEGRIFRIVLNLVSNAIKFTPKGFVKISVSVAKKINKKNIIKISIEDSGIGIPDDKKNLVFERFARCMPNNKNAYFGSGLGLYIVKEFIEELQGEINVESTLGQGTTFTCLLPMSLPLDDAVLLSPSEVKPAVKKISPNLKILLVEDDDLAQIVAEAILTKHFSAKIDAVTSGYAAIDYAKRFNYDMIFMDLGLPDISGSEAAEKIRDIKKDKTPPIIALTAHDVAYMQKDRDKKHLNDFIIKPLTAEKARVLMNKWFGDEKE